MKYPKPSMPLLFSVLPLLLGKVQGLNNCSSTADCEKGVDFCSDGTCIPIGTCQKEVDCFNQENNFASDACVGYLECQENQCTKTCSDSFCKPGSNDPDVVCPTVVCQPSDCEGAVSCVDHRCGDCEVFYFDEKGSRICHNENKAEPITTCSSTADCEKGVDFCSDGTCIPIGTCQKEVDCFNQENNFASVDCVGYLECQENQCTKTCSDSFCKPGSNDPDVVCPTVVCQPSDCEGAVSCVDHRCGDCEVFYFDEKGSRICHHEIIRAELQDGSDAAMVSGRTMLGIGAIGIITFSFTGWMF